VRQNSLFGYSFAKGGLGDVSNSGLLIHARKGPAAEAGPISKWLASLVLIATGYFLAGRLGQLLAVPPSYATAIWPASGIALAGVLLLGYRVWPGIFLGALLVNGWTPLSDADGIRAAVGALLVPGSISAGATIQALLGAFLVQRFVGFPNPLTQDRSILAFLVLSGPLACLVGASWGVATLAAVGAIEGASQLTLNWWTWWVGDVTGVIIFAPLTFICLAQPRTIWRPRWLSVALPLAAAFAVTVAGFILDQVLQQYRAKLQFDRVTANAIQLLEAQVAGHLEVIDSLERHYGNSKFIDRSEFASFNRAWRHRRPGTEAIGWLARMDASVAADFERRLHQGTLRDKEVEKLPKSMPSGTDDRFPVLYLEPTHTNVIDLGFDFSLASRWRDLLRRCCDSGRQVASRPIGTRMASGDPAHVLVFAPIYSTGDPPATVAQRRQTLRGYILGIYQIDQLVLCSLPRNDADEFSLAIIDGAEQLTVYPQSRDTSPHKASEVAPLLRQNIGESATIQFADRTWLCEFSSTPAFYAGQANRHTWMILAAVVCWTSA
jgi:CHASE1-domain containing sensor protein